MGSRCTSEKERESGFNEKGPLGGPSRIPAKGLVYGFSLAGRILNECSIFTFPVSIADTEQ